MTLSTGVGIIHLLGGWQGRHWIFYLACNEMKILLSLALYLHYCVIWNLPLLKKFKKSGCKMCKFFLCQRCWSCILCFSLNALLHWSLFTQAEEKIINQIIQVEFYYWKFSLFDKMNYYQKCQWWNKNIQVTPLDNVDNETINTFCSCLQLLIWDPRTCLKIQGFNSMPPTRENWTRTK